MTDQTYFTVIMSDEPDDKIVVTVLRDVQLLQIERPGHKPTIVVNLRRGNSILVDKPVIVEE